MRLRPEIAAMTGYRQGRTPPAGGFKLSSNENPFEPLPSVVARVAEMTRFNRYPDDGAGALRARLAARHGVLPAETHVGAGSISLITQLITAAAGPGDEVVYAWRSFEAYPGIVTVAGATSVRVPNTVDGAHDINGMIAAVTPRTRVVIVCSPNNPTGAVVTAADFERLIAAVPPDLLVVLDEAYCEFVQRGDGPDSPVDGDTVVCRHPNVVVLRTFSKAWGLAGLRVGYALGAADVLNAARACSITFSVSDLAQAAALISLDHEDELLQRVQALAARRDQVWRRLTEQGWTVPRPFGNFVWLPTGDGTDQAAAVLHAHGITGRPFAGEGVRVTIAEQESVDALLRATEDILVARAGLVSAAH